MKRFCSHCHKELSEYGSCEHRYAVKPPKRKLRTIGAAVAVIFGLTAPQAKSAIYEIEQVGWVPSGFLQGSFTGTDANSDGFIVLDELSNLSISLEGFSFDIADAKVFVWNTSLPYLGGLLAINGQVLLSISPDSSSMSSFPLGVSTHAPAMVRAVPEPPTWWLILPLIGFASTVAIIRKLVRMRNEEHYATL